MFEKIVTYLETRMEANATNPSPFDRRHVAVAALLVEASRLDGHYDAVEQGTVIRLLKDSLQMPPEQARTLLSFAEIRQANTYDDWIFCQAINRGFSTCLSTSSCSRGSMLARKTNGVFANCGGIFG